PERRARGHPFSREILAAPLPNNFKETNLVYDGSSDPSRHVRTFENMAVLHGYSDSICCRAFLSTLRGGALDWFHQLPSGSIADFEDFASKLTNQYSSAVAHEKTYLTLMAMRQGEKESLRKYVARYNQMCLEVHSASDEVKVGGLIRSLRAGPYRTSLAKTPARSYEEVLKRCRKYINLEEMEVEFAKLEGPARPEQKKEQTPPRGRSPRRSSPKRSGSKKTSPRREGRDSKREKRDDRWQGRPLCKGKEVFLFEFEEEEEPREESLLHMVKSKKRGPKMITFTAEVGGKLVEVLVDSGSTLNFIDEELSKEIDIPFTKVKPFGVKVANGETLRGDILFKGVKLKAQGQRMRVDLYALPLKAADVVLGCQWLETLGPITTDYWKGTMEFGRSSKRVKLRTEDPGG
ncbi:Unknown protein, partial [Striga hermonthica]